MEEYSTSFAEFERALKLSRDEIHTVSDNRQVGEILNSLGCLSYLGGEIERAMLFFRESLKVQKMTAEHSMYVGSKFSCHAASLNMSVTSANIGFLSLTFYRDTTESVAIFESALRVSTAVRSICGAKKAEPFCPTLAAHTAHSGSTIALAGCSRDADFHHGTFGRGQSTGRFQE
jgi:hypothetical protein